MGIKTGGGTVVVVMEVCGSGGSSLLCSECRKNDV